MKFFVSDDTGTTRSVARFLVADSGGTTRLVQRAFVSDPSGVTRQFWPTGFSFTLVAGTSGLVTGFGGSAAVGGPYGTLNGLSAPVAMPSGNYLLELSDDGSATYLIISGLLSNPGQTALGSILLNNKSFIGAAANQYIFNSNVNEASWAWTTISAGLVSGRTYRGSLSGTVVL